MKRLHGHKTPNRETKEKLSEDCSERLQNFESAENNKTVAQDNFEGRVDRESAEGSVTQEPAAQDNNLGFEQDSNAAQIAGEAEQSAEQGQKEELPDPLGEVVASAEVVTVKSASEMCAGKAKRHRFNIWRFVIAAIIIVPILSLALVGLFTNLFEKDKNASEVSSNEKGNFTLLLDYNMPEPLDELYSVLPEFSNVSKDGIAVGLVRVADGFITTSFRFTVLEKYFLGWDVINGDYSQGKIVGKKDTGVVARALWNEAALLKEFYTQGLKFECVGDEAHVTGVESNFSAQKVFIPEVYNGKPVTEISEGAFKGSSVKKIFLLGEYDTSAAYTIGIADSAFQDSALQEISFKAVDRIGDCAFKGCKDLQVCLDDSAVKSIGDFAFEGTKDLESFVLPSSVEDLGRDIFGDTSVKSFSFAKDSKFSFDESGLLTYKMVGNEKHLISCEPQAEGVLRVGQDVKVIEPNAFSGTGEKLLVCVVGDTIISESAFSNSKAVVALGEAVTNRDQITNLCTADSGFDHFECFADDFTGMAELVITDYSNELQAGYYLFESYSFETDSTSYFVIKVKLNCGFAEIEEVHDVTEVFNKIED